MGYYRRSEEPPRKRPRKKPKIEPWVCGHWCNGCIYARRINTGYCCFYYRMTGLHRADDEPTRECSVRMTRTELLRLRNEEKPVVVVGAVEGLMTYRQIGRVVQKENGVVCNWGKYKKHLGKRIEGYRGVQLTVDEAVALVQGHQYQLAEPNDEMTKEQKELLQRLREISEN